jgi:hypothetical protein
MAWKVWNERPIGKIKLRSWTGFVKLNSLRRIVMLSLIKLKYLKKPSIPTFDMILSHKYSFLLLPSLFSMKIPAK